MSSSLRRSGVLVAAALLGSSLLALLPLTASAQESPAEPPALIELHFTPTGRAQLALWIEDAAGTLIATVGLTEAVALRGIGNRPGASQMNSGFRWPYGRREGVLPVWAQRRAAAPGASQFRRVIFSNRRLADGQAGEGLASTSPHDVLDSPDDYFCLSFNTSRSQKDALDAVSCASAFNSDKGRFITEADVQEGYAEPYEDTAIHTGRMEPLTATSLYPPRHDVHGCTGLTHCNDTEDVAGYDAHVREVLPDIDTITMATPMGGEDKHILFSVPHSWPAGRYRACVEANVEGDYNETFDAARFPTPKTPDLAWDSWAVGKGYGYPYRGQPSVVYCVELELGEQGVVEYTTDIAAGSVGGWETTAEGFGTLTSMDGMTDSPVEAPGSGGDRLMVREDGHRLKVVVKPPLQCKDNAAPSAAEDLALSNHPNRQHAHEWVELAFRAAEDDTGVFRYDVRVSSEPIVDELSFLRGHTAKNASVAAEELRVPTEVAAGEMIRVQMGGLVAQTHYYVGVRAVDGCAQTSALRVEEFTTPRRVFATVTPCFVATAAYGTPLAAEISALRRLRDRHLASNVVGRAAVDLYGWVGPKLATLIADNAPLRSLARAVLTPVVALARSLDD
jgi:hypothetical protein